MGDAMGNFRITANEYLDFREMKLLVDVSQRLGTDLLGYEFKRRMKALKNRDRLSDINVALHMNMNLVIRD